MRRRRWPPIAIGVMASVLGVGLVFAHGGDPASTLRFTQDVPDDVRRETDAVWERFVDRFDARRSCWSDVSVVLVRSVDDGDARYVVSDARIEIQIPTTPARYRESLVHELAHHVERTCDDFEPLRAVLLPRLAGAGADWYVAPTWEAIPSEQFAEAVVLLVNEERVRHEHEVPVDPTVVDLVARWGVGDAVAG